VTIAAITLHGDAYRRLESLPSGQLSDEHAMSSRGLPVVIVDGQALGPADLPARTTVNVWTTGVPYPETAPVGSVAFGQYLDQIEAIRRLAKAAANAGYDVVTDYRGLPA